MPLLKDIISELEKQFPPCLQESYDNAGIQVFSGDENIKQCLVTLDVTLEVVDEAVKTGCNLIVAHHPLIFGRGLMHITEDTLTERIILKAIKNSVSIYCAHTNADSVLYGTSKVMFDKIGISDYKILLPDNKSTDFQSGAGAIGELKEEMPSLDFLKMLKKVFSCGALRHTEIIKEKVKKIAICSGSGSFLLKEAIKQGADVFVSGDFTYHKFFDADKKIIIADLGHFETEIGIKQIFCDILQKKFINFAVRISDINTNPIKYL
ncbi:MAG: Nif3-like dinuclear metal center hexameric protein [Bacteroidales bacterium]|jgi:dinuclear metal center YbgI/SA1388 family protein|nr:Nif3-like dinuclear metal center hexameric protein [Bacteroidales bacterium]MBR6278135.1 Nif3-like dinuclear metal center hexameric protein [Bacteroidales bacterium]MCR4560578.1 Nif3-like dinuclear metal center hexameric protein [Bacteroidales bacterium]